MSRRFPEELRSHRWLGVNDLRAFGHRARLRQGGFDAADFRDKPVIGIINTWSDINFCHTHLRERAEDVKRGVLQAGGFPVELPAMSLSEPFVKPSTMLYRNLLAMETGRAPAQPSHRWRRAYGRLRQDHAGVYHGRNQYGTADDLCAGGATTARQLAWSSNSVRVPMLGNMG